MFPSPPLSARQRECEDRILLAAETAIAAHGSHNLTLSALALGLKMAPGTIRRYFPDANCLLGEILARHLRRVTAEVEKISDDAPERDRRRRAAYLAATRLESGGLTRPHLLLLRERHNLPGDLLEPIRQARLALGERLAGPIAALGLALLDTPALGPAKIESVIHALRMARLTAEPPRQPSAFAAIQPGTRPQAPATQ